MNLPKNHVHMGKIIQATQVATPGMDPRRARIIIVFLAICTALQMTSYGMIFPLFARMIGDFGDGVAVLGDECHGLFAGGHDCGAVYGIVSRSVRETASNTRFICSFHGRFHRLLPGGHFIGVHCHSRRGRGADGRLRTGDNGICRRYRTRR